MSESNKPELIKWDKMEVSPYRYSKLNWMNGIVANRDAVKTYSDIEGDKRSCSLLVPKGIYVVIKGVRS